MRGNSGKGDSNNNLRDPTLKEHEAERGKSGEAILKRKDDKEAHGGDVAPPNSDDAGATRSPEMGEPERH